VAREGQEAVSLMGDKTCSCCGKIFYGLSCTRSWDCEVARARAEGYVDLRPNGLPVRCIHANPPMLLECGHGDHQDYKFPVKIEQAETDHDPWLREYPQTHALIYTDGHVLVTMYECCYAMWDLTTRAMLGSRYQPASDRLSEASAAKVRAYCIERGMLKT